MTHPARYTLAAMPYVLAGIFVLVAVWAAVCGVAWLFGYDLASWRV